MRVMFHTRLRNGSRRRPPVSGRLSAAALVLLLGAWCLLTAVPMAGAAISSQPTEGDHTTLDKSRLSSLLEGKLTTLTKGGPVSVSSEALGPLAIHTSIDPELQKTAEKLLLRQGKNLRSAVVVVDAESGRVLAMAGSKKRKLDPRVALDAGASAASLFKVITAAATLEEHADIQPQTKMAFAGRAHTLYQYQVYKKTKRRMHLVTLEKGFAQSNNPVFARLGVHWLGKDVLNDYAGRFGFGRKLNFELPVGVSLLPKPADQFGLGELACGYERHTTISPLHAALMVSVFTNGGRFVEPYLVDWVTGAGGEVLYHGHPQSSSRLVSSNTCQRMRTLFEATVREGTARRAFKRLYRDRVLKNLEVGGKTGTLRGPDRKELFEWFAGYGRDPVSGRTLAVASLVVHGQVRRANPDRLARKVLRKAFDQKSQALAPKHWDGQAKLPTPSRTGWQAAKVAAQGGRVE